MKYKIRYWVGKDLREKNIEADTIEDAEFIANKKFTKWEDIISLNKIRKEK
jgi:hypothetical protein